jgi:hypothetical protein
MMHGQQNVKHTQYSACDKLENSILNFGSATEPSLVYCVKIKTRKFYGIFLFDKPYSEFIKGSK